MKTIFLQDFIAHIKGVVIYGHPNPRISNVLKSFKYSKVTHNTMFFHKGKMLSLKGFASLKQVVVISSNPQNLQDVGSNVTIVQVKKIRKAYWRFIDYYRNLFQIPFVAVTGTCGKTTTKEMVSWIFEKDKNVYKTISNHNDPSRNFGYLLGIQPSTDIVVMETAVARPGHLKESYRYFKPHVGILTSIGIDHLNGFPTLEAYQREKLSIFSLIREDGTVIINMDDERINKLDLNNFNKNLLTFGAEDGCDFKISDIEYGDNEMKYTIIHQSKNYKFSIPGLGKHNVQNAAAAIATAYALGVEVAEAGKRLSDFPRLPRHVEIIQGIKGSTIIDDTWSTNPTSIQSAFEVLKNISKGRKKIAVLGEIKYLGNRSKEVHELVGKIAASHELDFLFTIGEEALPIALQAKELGMDESTIFPCKSPREAYEKICRLISNDSVVLVKTSMFQSYNKFINALKA
ncbi:Mur ligase family protein [Bacillus dakarensis]|uniref:Mur ligase family protein n=1 Tax=Robertmurraya dakarensis TaxID=1926278 RepID=UPI00098159DA|nr:Mur ligase family protein [Bacillus dakarensis]